MKYLKKIALSLCVIALVFTLSGCEIEKEKGNYKKGTYFGYAKDTYGGKSAYATCVLTVAENGMIESAFLDTTYDSNGELTTKKVLRENYGMVKIAHAEKEWYEQVELLEKAVVENQGISFIKWTNPEKTKTDSISGVTIQINALYEALDNAINQAK